MFRHRTEQIKSRLDTVPALSGAPNFPRGIAWTIAGILILGGILYCTQGSSTQLMEPLFGGRVLSDHEFAEVEIAFSDASLRGWSHEHGRVLVPNETRHEFLSALSKSHALPYTLKSGVDEALSAFSGGSYFESESARRFRHQQLKAAKLADTIIATFEDISWATVVYDTKQAGGFDDQTVQSASVAVMPKNGKPIAPSRIGMIQNFVCGAYAAMKPEHVTVTDTSAKKTYNGSDDPETRQQRQEEYELEQRLTELLSGYRGVHIAARSVLVIQHDAEKVATNNPTTIRKSTVPPKRVPVYQMQVSVGVPESQFHAQWINDFRAQHPGVATVKAPTAEQLSAVKSEVMANIREAVHPMISVGIGGEADAIRVWSFPDSYRTTAYGHATAGQTRVASFLAFLRSNSSIAVPVGGLLLIATAFAIASTRLRLRTSVVDPKRPVTASIPNTADRPATSTNAVSVTDETTLKDELADLVETNPELAAQIVHSWIADAA